MTFFDNLQSRIAGLDKKTWYQYLAITAGVLFFAMGLILFFYYRATSKWEERIAEINESRIKAKRLLDKAIRVQKERKEVEAILAEDPNFKIAQYMRDLFEKVGISEQNNVASTIPVTTAREDNYQETGATYQIIGITMKQLTELLNEIDQNKRVFIKELDISKSKKIPRAIDVEIKVATMMPKETA